MLKKYFRRKEDRKGEDAKCAIAVIEDDEEEMEGSDLHLIKIESKESVYDVNVNSDLEEHQKQELNNILHKYDNVFTTISGTTNMVEDSIKLTTDEPVVCRPYPIPFTSRNNLRGSIKEIEKMKVIRKSDSQYASPVVVVKKKRFSRQNMCRLQKAKQNHLS